MKAPEPLVVNWRGHQVRIRHDDAQLTISSPRGSRLRSAIGLASDVEGLRLVLTTALGDRYRVKVSDDESIIELWRLPWLPAWQHTWQHHSRPGAADRAG